MNVHLNKPQTKIYSSHAKYVACTAGLGSGKTFAIGLKMMADFFNFKGAHLCYLAPTYSLIADIIYPLLEEILSNANIPYSLNKTDAVMTVPGYGRIFFRSMTKPEKIIGFSIFRAYLDEIDTIPQTQAEVVLDKIIARIRQIIPGQKNQLYLISSPEGYRFMYHNFEKTPLLDSELIRMTTYDNEHNLPPDYIPTMKAKYSKSLIEAYLMGNFVNLNALGVWVDFDRKYNASKEEVYNGERIHVGMDFNVGRGCAVVHVARDKSLKPIQIPTKGHLHAVDEIHGMLDTPATIAEIQGRYPNNPVTVYPDSSGKSKHSVNATESDLALLRAAKFLVKVKSKNPNLKDRITAANAQFCDGNDDRKYFVNIDKCPVYTDCLEQQPYDDKGKPVKDGIMDDITDAGTYPIAYLFPVKNNRATMITTGGI